MKLKIQNNMTLRIERSDEATQLMKIFGSIVTKTES